MYKMMVSLCICDSKINICNLSFYIYKEEIYDSTRSLVKTDISELDMMLEICQCKDLYNKARGTVA